MKFITTIIVTFCVFAPFYTQAKMQDELGKFFDDMGYNSNVTSGGAYQDQQGGYFTGGNIHARVPARNYELYHFQMPSYKAGCGGIDMFGGAFSFIDAKRFQGMMTNIASNASGYAFNLSLQTFTPQIYNTIQKLNDVMREMNLHNINSCESAAALVGGVWPRTDASSQYLCNAMGANGGSTNKFTDWSASRQECGAGGKRHETISGSRSDGEYKDVLGDEYNLVWHALKKNSFFSNDQELAEQLMSVTGTIIAKLNGEKMQKIPYSSLADDHLIEAMMYGRATSTAKIYKCIEKEDCLSISIENYKVSEHDALVNKVGDILQNIVEKVRAEESGDGSELSQNELGLINSTRIPIMKLINVQAALRGGGDVFHVSQYKEAIAYDMILHFLEQAFSLVTQNLSQLQQIKVDNDDISQLKSDMERARRQLINKRHNLFQQILVTLNMIEQGKSIEKYMLNQAGQYNTLVQE